MSSVAIRTHNLTRTFGAIRAVDQLTLDVRQGEIFGFLGPNGSGKTTTIRLLLGLLQPDAGQIEVLGFAVPQQASEVRMHTGTLLEHSGLYERLSAADNLDYYGRIWRIPASQRRERIRELLVQVGLWERRHEPVKMWSRGMKQKLAIARALLHRPQLIFLDEPTAGLDPIAAAAFRDDLRALAEREGVTVFLTTHNLDEAEKLCHRVGIIRHGRLLAQGSLAEIQRHDTLHLEIIGRNFIPSVEAALRSQPTVRRVEASDTHLMIELASSSDPAPLIKLVIEHGGQIEEVYRKQNASLEEVFLTLMAEETTYAH
ncbi:MAG: ABC transporter [Chloroflexus sp.]|uniref:ABC transporter ATP-binding protein n=1 Tax=Chloroflexus sp. TaxID=1904827 RepID=UPI000F20657F|nr:ABC transporter ATP-binding protein [Chloroflexus sp.]RMD73024.1 MAG: ABC transporter ATP-binding protein [Chloroflexota bacterium]GIV90903.1 MAG: ABC transporter [Chloroflexus sp.]